MRLGFIHTLVFLFFAAFTFGMPVTPEGELTKLNDIFGRELGPIPQEIEQNWANLERAVEEGLYDAAVIDKREVKILTDLMLLMNKTGSGVLLINGFCTNPATLGTTKNAIVAFLKTQDLTALLKAASDSGLAVDIVIMILTHMEAFKGLVQVGKKLWLAGTIHFKRDGQIQKRGFFSDAFNGVLSIFGLGGLLLGLTQATTSAQGNQATTTTSAKQASSAAQTSATVKATGTVGLGLSQITATAVRDDSGVTSGISVVTPNTAAAAASAAELANKASVDPNAAIATFDANAIPSGDLAAADALQMFQKLNGNTDIFSGGVAASGNNTAAASSGPVTLAAAGLLGGLLGGVGDLVGGVINGVGNVIGGVVGGLMGILNNAEKTLFTGLLNAINLAGSMEDICVSLQKSGLGVSVVHNVFSDPKMQAFAADTVTEAVNEGALTLLKLLSAVSGSGILSNVITTILGNSTYRSIVFSFVVLLLFNFSSIFLL